MKLFFSLLIINYSSFIYSQSSYDSSLIGYLISSNKHLFKEYLSNPSKYEVQIIYTQINRDEENKPSFITFAYGLNAEKYFYPASTVKLPTALLALEKINDLKIKDLNRYTALQIDSVENWQTPAVFDSTSPNGLPSVAHYIKKIFLVSDNDAYNRLYEFLGQEYLNEKLWSKGLVDCRIVSRLSVFLSPEQNACTNPIKFYSGNKLIYSQPEIGNEKKYPNKLQSVKLGIGYYQNDSLINEPKDFSNSNFVSLEVLHEIMKRLFFPDVYSVTERFNLTDDDYNFIYKYMAMYPRESLYPKYVQTAYPDNYVKFFMFGNSNDSINRNIRIFNKVGQAYGYLIDNAYIADFKNGVEFLLSAVIYVNDDQIFNDDKYEYDEIGFPFLSNLGKVIYEYELKRYKKFPPDLCKFNLMFNENKSDID